MYANPRAIPREISLLRFPGEFDCPFVPTWDSSDHRHRHQALFSCQEFNAKNLFARKFHSWKDGSRNLISYPARIQQVCSSPCNRRQEFYKPPQYEFHVTTFEYALSIQYTKYIISDETQFSY